MTSSAEAVAAITENNLVTDESNAAKADATEEESYVMSVENKPEEVELSNEISSLQISGNDKNNDNESHNNAPKVKITRTTPRRNPSTESARSGPLPTIEECLFGNKPVIAMDGSLLPEEQRKEEDYILPLNLLRRVASQGIDDGDDTVENQSSLRALSWRVLLGYLPMDRREWKSTTAKQRASYHTFVQELFAIDKRDIDGTELRGHHAKRRSKLKVKRTKSEKERRRKDKLKQKQELLEAADSSPRAPIKFVNDDNDEEDDSNDNNASSQWLEAAPSEDISEGGGVPSDLQEESAAEKAANHHTLEQIVQEPSHWNLSDREQKILERLTNHQAVNQLLVKRDCAEWNNFLENATLLDEIRKDVNRTHPHLYFYLEPKRQLGARRYGALERILFVWAKLNKGVRYVQGMNEIVGTLYYVLANDYNEPWADHAEADTYILFNIIMSEIRDIFVADLDTADTGIHGRIENMHNLLGLHDPQVKGHLDAMGIDASFYAVRWLTTLLSREFLLPDTIRLWDSMFASTHKENFLRYVCVTMVLRIREDLLKGDFATCLQLLQKYPSCSMDDLLDSSRALWIYESQITMACVKGGLTLHQSLNAIPPPDKIVMAFGLKGGITLSNREQLAEVGANAKEAVKNNVQKAKESMQTLSSAGQGILGGARRFIRGRIQRNRSDGDPSPTGNDGEEDGTSEPPMPRRRLPFRNVSWSGRATSNSTDNGDVVAAATPVTPNSIDDDHLL